mmetsp:Transcript_6987/g.9448  ORF Transcript_6987/g.9448 Transcript_6987/m.9448 type:complete len:213 (+) Transcript_6987:415-1053(+)
MQTSKRTMNMFALCCIKDVNFLKVAERAGPPCLSTVGHRAYFTTAETRKALGAATSKVRRVERRIQGLFVSTCCWPLLISSGINPLKKKCNPRMFQLQPVKNHCVLNPSILILHGISFVSGKYVVSNSVPMIMKRMDTARATNEKNIRIQPIASREDSALPGNSGVVNLLIFATSSISSIDGRKWIHTADIVVIKSTVCDGGGADLISFFIA